MSNPGQTSKHQQYADYLTAYRQYEEARRKYHEHIKSLISGSYSDPDAFVGIELANALKTAFDKWMEASKPFARSTRQR